MPTPPKSVASQSSPSMAALLFSAALFLISGWAPTGAIAATFGFDVHHRFSEPVKRWVEFRSSTLPGAGVWWWAERDTVDYYAALAHHDRTLHGRALFGSAAAVPPTVTFSNGNATLRISSLGFLHYAIVSVGTPSVMFLVALDTDNDLFWLPYDCTSCAPTSFAGNKEQIQAVIAADIIGPLVHLLQTAEFDIQKEAALAISNATFCGTHDQIKLLVSQGCIKPLCDLLVCPDPAIVRVCLEGLENILWVGEDEKNLGSTGCMNPYARMIDNADGLKKIESSEP